MIIEWSTRYYVDDERTLLEGYPPALYRDMLGDPEEVDVFFRLPSQGEVERFIRVAGMPDLEEEWVN